MFRRLHLVLAALAMLVAPLAMQSGMAMAAMPMDQREMAQSGHCGDEDGGQGDQPGSKTQCCYAMCSAVTPLGAAAIEPAPYPALLLFALRSSEHRSFLPELPTPPPRGA